MIAHSSESALPVQSGGNTIIGFFLENVNQYAGKVAAKVKRKGRYENVTWGEMGDDAKQVALALVGEGVQQGEHIAIMANTRYEWCSVDMGNLWAGAVTVPIYPSTLPEDTAYIIDDSESVVAFVEDDVQATKFRAQRDNMSKLRRVVQLDGEVTDSGNGWIIGFEEFLKKAEGQNADELDARASSLTPESILTIIYTSGTTGKPKGVVLTHDAMAYEGEATEQVGVIMPEDVQLFFLPLAHVFAKVLEISWLTTRHTMAFAESFQTIKDNMGETQPSLMCAVPRVYEKFHAAVVEKATAAGGLKAKLFQSALALSVKNGELEQQGRGGLSGVDAFKFKILKGLIFKKIGAGLMELMGGRMRVMVSGGAPLSPKISFFFRDAGLEILEGYGLTETSAASFCNRPGENRIGTVGPPMPGTQVKIAEDGEILIKGRGVMREYWKRPEATAEVLKDGWFHTGDIGELDAHGCLKITDRKKDIIVTAGGKNVAPQNIENLMKHHKLVANFVVHGDQRKFLSALVTLDPDALKEFADKRGLQGSLQELSKNPEIRQEIDTHIRETNAELASYETIKKYEILEHDFSVETGELTPKLSVKRKVVSERYGEIFDRFYAE
ncbi:MAG: long-chain fatty acid--CoA ligase [Myxococcota bacterium]